MSEDLRGGREVWEAPPPVGIATVERLFRVTLLVFGKRSSNKANLNISAGRVMKVQIRRLLRLLNFSLATLFCRSDPSTCERRN